MSSSIDKTKQFRNKSELDIGKPFKPIRLLGDTKRDRDTGSDLAVSARIDEFPTLELLAIDVDQLPTQVGLQAILKSPVWSSPATNAISIYDEQTRPFSVRPESNTASNKALPSAIQAPGDESYLGLIRNLVKNSGIYAISSLASPLITLLLAPFLTHMLSRTDYGALAVINTAVALATGVTELGLGAAFMRMYAYDSKTPREQLDVLSTLVLFLLLILIPVTILGVIAAPWLSVLLLGSASYSRAIQVGAVLVLSQNLTVPGLAWLRAESRAAFFSTISIGNLLVTAAASLILVGILHMGIVGALAANGFGDVIIIACTFPIIFWRTGFYLRFAMVGSMLAFGVPNVINLVSGWVLQLSDRYLLGHFASLSMAAGYSVAYSLGGVLSATIIAPFSLAWWVLMYPIAKRKDAKHVFKLIIRGFSFVLLFATLGLSLFGSSVLYLLFPASYYGQSAIIPIIALSIMFSGICTVVGLGTSLQRKTWLTSIYFIVSAIINIGLNIVLIPVFGTMGAALATLVAYIVLALVAYLVNQRIYPVPFEVGLFLVALGIGILLYLLGNRLAQGQNNVVAWGVHISALLLYGLFLLFMGGFTSLSRRTHSIMQDHIYTQRHIKRS
jgi:O-antigen/teichoic acid export membrane protein